MTTKPNAAEAYIQARQVLARVPACVLRRQTYGFPKCSTHSSGQDTYGLGYCDKCGWEGHLREALENLTGALALKVDLSDAPVTAYPVTFPEIVR